MQNLAVTTIQTDIAWEDIEVNLAMFDRHVNSMASTDVIVLPEMFSTGFSMSAAALAEKEDGLGLAHMREWAKSKDVLVIGSLIIKEASNYFNRLYAVFPDGKFQQYDKRHLFRMAKEDETFSFDHPKTIVHWRGWKVLPLVCYDLRFPVWSRNTVQNDALDYDLLVYVANWPAARIDAWDALLKARAIENLSYTVGLNRVGEDGKGIAYNGHSGIYDPKGRAIYFSEAEEIVKTTLSGAELMEYRAKFPAFLDADQFEIR